MELIRSWILSVTAAAMIIALAEALMPPGAVKRAAKLTGGLVLMLGILQPLVRMDYDELFIAANGTGTLVSSYAQPLEGDDFLKILIEQELNAYVLDKAQSFGALCTVSIICALGENNVPYPERAIIGGLDEADAQRKMRLLLHDDLGIPYERQQYLDEETP